MVIQGQLEHRKTGSPAATMAPGSYLSASAGAPQVACRSGEDCLVYLRLDGRFDVVAAQPWSRRQKQSRARADSGVGRQGGRPHRPHHNEKM